MVKTRMGLLDLRVQTAKFSEQLVGARVANVYDASNGRTYILKLAVPPYRSHHNASKSSTPSSSSQLEFASDDSAMLLNSEESAPAPSSSMQPGWQKKLLLIESGVRLHMTQFDREKDLPSGFCLKLRKHIRTKRLEAVRQLGSGGDRILDLVFSSAGVVTSHLIVEAFAGGNVILTDPDYTILTLLRAYKADSKSAALITVKQRYPIESARCAEAFSYNRFQLAVQNALKEVPSPEEFEAATTRVKRKMRSKIFARSALASSLSLEPSLVEHALLIAQFDPDVHLSDVCENDDGLQAVFEALRDVDADLESAMHSDSPMRGYIISKDVENPNGTIRRKYEEFAPYLFAQYRNRPYVEYPTFDDAADEFFSKLETERAEASLAKREAAAFKKVDKLASELKGQVSILENARDLSWERAQAIESNIVEVEAAITVIRSAVAAAVSWDGLAKMVQDEKRNGNPVAEIIHSLQLDRNEITLMLEDTFGVDDEEDGDNDSENELREDDDDEDDDGDEDEDADDDEDKPRSKRNSDFRPSAETRKALLIPVDISLGAHANARRHYEMRKSAAAKMEKAVQASDRTIKAASKRAANEAHKLEAEAVAASIRARRKPLWFEKFFWFISSENYLVVAGHDAQQNELLVKRYLGPADVYVHADLQGASSVIVKNRKHEKTGIQAEIPRMTLEQAGTFAMCRSTAWDSKIVTSAWWVRASQISKTTASGVYLPTGNFVIRGKKNFLDPAQLIMGFAFLFKVDEASAQNHIGERGIRGLEDGADNGDGSQGAVAQPNQATLPSAANMSPDPNTNVDAAVAQAADPSVPPVEDDTMQSSQSDETNMETTEDVVKPDVILTEEKGVPEVDSVQKPPGSKKKHLSARERKILRKGKSGGSKNAVNSSDDTAEDRAERRLNKSQGKPNAPLPRGKKHKLKKLKKYSDQDEEERRIALAVLGSKPMKGEEDDLAGNDEEDGGASVTGNEKAGEEEEDNSSTYTSREERPEKQEDMRLLDAEGLAELARIEEETTQLLSMLTAKPCHDDVVQFALPICAPHVCLVNYRYKVKLMPGSMKRGKAYRAAVALFLKQAEKDLANLKQDRDALRLSPESDGIQGMLGNVKIMAPGLAEAQKSLQKVKKPTKKGSKK